MRRISPERLALLRNRVSIDQVIQLELKLPTKYREGCLRFVCPRCGEFNTATNPKTNLARCFTCQKNYNTIDIIMTVQGLNFLQAVEKLSTLLHKL
jgi:DNA primase